MLCSANSYTLLRDRASPVLQDSTFHLKALLWQGSDLPIPPEGYVDTYHQS